VREFHEAILEILSAGRPAAAATIVKAGGSTPRAVGARMIVTEEGPALFTLGGGSFEAEVIKDAREAIRTGEAALKIYNLSDRGPRGDGQECGGSATIFIEPLTPAEKLWVFGGGHVARALIASTRGLGFDVTVFEDREDHARLERLPGAARVIHTDEEYRRSVSIPDERTRCVVLTRSHRTDRAALRAALSGRASWVGMIGSTRKRLAVYKDLREEDGVAEAVLSTVECPVGLPIGAETPEEIAVSILSRLIQLRRQPPAR
jgi:xanthine dehydrogenase accessory factor